MQADLQGWPSKLKWKEGPGACLLMMQRTAQAGEATEGAGGRTAAGVEDVGKLEQIRLRAGTGEVPLAGVAAAACSEPRRESGAPGRRGRRTAALDGLRDGRR